MKNGMKRERALQVVLVVVGLFYFAWIYFLFGALWHSSWLNGNHQVEPMFVSLNMVLGAFVLLAAKQPAKHRSLIAYGLGQALPMRSPLAIQTAEAWAHGIHRNPWDIVIIGMIGVVLLALLPAKQPAPASSALYSPCRRVTVAKILFARAP